MHVFHTAGVPPSIGSSILPIIGWTRKSSVALTKRVAANKNSSGKETSGKGKTKEVGRIKADRSSSALLIRHSGHSLVVCSQTQGLIPREVGSRRAPASYSSSGNEKARESLMILA